MRNRSTTDLLVLLIAGTICAAVLLTGATVGILAITSPSTDTSDLRGNLFDVITTLIGLLAGFIAGRTDKVQREAADTPNSPPPPASSSSSSA